MKNHKWLHLSTFQSKIIASAIVLMAGAIVVVSVMSYSIVSSIIIKKVYQDNYNYVETVADSTVTLIEEAKYKIQHLSEVTRGMLKEYKGIDSEYDRAEYWRALDLDFEYYLETNSELKGIMLIAPGNTLCTGNMVSTIDRNVFIETEAYQILLNNSEKPVVIPPILIGNNMNTKELQEIILAKHFTVEESEYILLFFLNLADFISWYDRGQVLITLDDGAILWSTGVEDYYPGFFSDVFRKCLGKSNGNVLMDGRYYITYYRDPVCHWYFFNIVGSHRIQLDLKWLYRWIWGCSLIIGSIFLLLILFFSSKIVKPLVSLKDSIKKIKGFNANPINGVFSNSIFDRLFRRVGLKGQLVVFYCFHTIIPTIILTILIFIVAQGIVVRRVKQSVEGTIEYVGNNISYFMEGMERVTIPVALFDETQTLLFKSNSEDEDNKLRKGISSKLLKQEILRKGIAYINIYDIWGIQRYSTWSINSRDYVSNSKPKNYYYNMNNSIILLKGGEDISGNYVYSFIRSIRLKIPDEESRLYKETLVERNVYSLIGYIELGMFETSLAERYQSLNWGENSEVFIMSRDGYVVSHTDKKMLGSQITDFDVLERVKEADGIMWNTIGNNYVLYMPMDTTSNWVFTVKIPTTQILKDNYNIIRYNVYILAILALINIIMAYVISWRIVLPLSKLQYFMQKVDKGVLDYYYDTQGNNDEIGALIKSFNQMMGRLKQMVNEVYESRLIQKELEAKRQEMEHRKKEAELIAFQSQINPHFLYNTFSSISFMMLMGKNNEAAKMLDTVGRLFRKGIYRGEVIVDAQEELDHVRAYVEIQQMRYEDKLNVEWRIEPEVYHCKLLKLTLQPLVENSIYHGIEMKEGPGTVIIQGKKEDKKVCFLITDDGVGISDEQLQSIKKNIEEGGNGRSIGLRNVNERIKLYFGNEYGLEIYSRKNQGTSVLMSIPVIEK